MGERTTVVLDIETVPDRTLYDPERDGAKTERRAGTEGAEDSFPPPWAHQVVVVGLLWLGPDLAFRRLGTVGQGATDEARILRDLAAFLDQHHPAIVSFNGRRFDLPVLALRSLRHGIPARWFYWQNNAYRQRFRSEWHADLCEELSDHGSVRRSRLDAVARLVGLPGKFGVDGSQVDAMVERGEIEAVRRYCLADVIQTTLVWLRYLVLRGELDPTAFREKGEALRKALSTQPAAAELLALVEWDRYLLGEAGGGEGS